MSKGNRIVKCRINSVQALAIEFYIRNYNAKQTDKEPLNMSGFLRKAIAEKLSHAFRGGNKTVVLV
jgi:hypothetical protein